jgi:nucleoside-diphosphate-sugar epimerase
MRILITGGCGYLGSRLSEYFAHKGNEIIILDKNLPQGNENWKALITEFLIGDICDPEFLNSIKNKNIDAVIHTVSLDHNYSQKLDFKIVSEINIQPTYNILNVLKEQNLKYFIYFSTQQVYGRVPNIRISETYQPAPVNNYGLTHAMSEDIVNYFNISTPINCINIRLSNSYGRPVFKENNCWWLVINDFCKSAVENGKIIIQSDGTPQRDFVNIDDLCKGIEILLSSQKNKEKNIYNIGSGITLTVLELAFLVADIYHKKFDKELPVYFSTGKEAKPEDVSKSAGKFQYDIEKMKSIGFNPLNDMESGILGIFNFLIQK